MKQKLQSGSILHKAQTTNSSVSLYGLIIPALEALECQFPCMGRKWCRWGQMSTQHAYVHNQRFC